MSRRVQFGAETLRPLYPKMLSGGALQEGHRSGVLRMGETPLAVLSAHLAERARRRT